MVLLRFKYYAHLFKINKFCTCQSNIITYIHVHPTCPQSYHHIIKRDVNLHLDFITEEEENSLVKEVDPIVGRRRYEFDHWDDAIHGYRETDRSSWEPSTAKIFDRVRKTASIAKTNSIEPVHILDLAEDGWIKPHVDSVRFSGNIIAGLSLLTDSVMRFVSEENKDIVFDVLLKRRSLYIMRDTIRFKFKHEILKNEESYFNGIHVPKGRRISLICRNQKSENNQAADT